MDCKLCDLCISRKNVVLGSGNDTGDIMILGEAPGYHEDKTGEPFVGESGKFLRKCLKECRFAISDIFITNVVKCRPLSNRTPSSVEIYACTSNFLSREIQHVNPIFVITAGSTSTNLMTNTTIPMHKQVLSTIVVGNMWIFPIYHPSYILQNNALTMDYIKRLNEIHRQMSIIKHDYAFEIASRFNKHTKSPF